MFLRRLALLGWLGAGGLALAQTPADHAAQIEARYEAMLQADPLDEAALDRLWQSTQARGTTEQLIERYRVAAADLPGCLVLGSLLRRAGRLDEAVAAEQRAMTLDPSSPLPPLALAELAMARNQAAQAAPLYQQAVDKMPAADRRQNDTLIKLGAAWMAAGQPRAAATSWERVLKRSPENAGLRRQLARIYEANGMMNEAIDQEQQLAAHAEPAERVQALQELARLQETRGGFDQARDALDQALTATAGGNWLHGEIAKSIVSLYERAGRGAELKEKWEAEAAKAPRNLEICERLADFAREQGDLVAERRWLEKTVELAPGDRESAQRLAALLAKNNERARAAALYDTLLKERPSDPDLVFARAELDVQMGQLSAAAERAEKLAAAPGGDAAAALQFLLRNHLDDAAERQLKSGAASRALEPSLALARFYFSLHREAEGRATLDALSGDAREWNEIADAYRQADLIDEAVRAWRKAAELDPGSTAPLIAAADVLSARGDFESAAGALRDAVGRTTAGPQQTDIDRRLFQALNQPTVKNAGDLVSREITELLKAASNSQQSGAYLRLAQWQSWAHDLPAARESARLATEAKPAGSIAAQAMLASLALESGEREEAERLFGALAEKDGEHRNDWLRKLANVKSDDGDFDAALETFGQLAAAAPSIETLNDLAMAQQRANRWYDAQATWERALSLPHLTAAQRTDERRSLLAVLERLREFPRAAETLQAEADDATDAGARSEAFAHLADFSRKHGLIEPLEKRCEQMVETHPQDFVALADLAELRKQAGRFDDAHSLLTRAYYLSPDPASALRELEETAENAGDTEAAVADQRRLEARTGLGAEKLAALQMANCDEAAAIQTWNDLCEKNPRDAALLTRAADFFETLDQAPRERALLRQAVALDPADLKRIFRLAVLDKAAGNFAQAAHELEGVLARSTPEKPGEPAQLPPVNDETTKPPENDRAMRLAAIRELAPLAAKATQPWTARWQKAAAEGARNEPLWAFFYAGQRAQVIELAARGLAEHPSDPSAEKVFLRLNLELAEYPPIALWVGQDSDRADRMLDAVAYFLNDGGEPDDAMVDELLRGRSREVRWRAASIVFAARQRYAQAIALGRPICAEVTASRAAYASEVAGWCLLMGQIQDARTLLREAIEAGGADTFEPTENKYFAVLREYWYLLPESERGGFAESFLQNADRRGGPAQAWLSRALVHGLSGAEAQAESDLDRVVDLRMLAGESEVGSADSRRWSYLLANGNQLAEWGLGRMAIHLWRRALGEASDFQRQDAECKGVLASIRGRLAGEQIVLAQNSSEAEEHAEDYLRSKPDVTSAGMVAKRLMRENRPEAAIRIDQYLVRTDPNDGEHVRDLLEACAQADDHETLRGTLRDRLALRIPAAKSAPGLRPAELAIRLASEMERDDDTEGARRMLIAQLSENPGSTGVAAALARLDEETARLDEAAQTLRSTLGRNDNVALRLQLAGVESRQGHAAQARDVLRPSVAQTNDPTHLEAAARLVRLELAAGNRQAANDLARDPHTALAAAMQERPANADLLRRVLKSGADLPTRFAAQLALLDFSSSASLAADLGRLKRLAGSDAERRVRWEKARFEQMHRLKMDDQLELQLSWEWARGEASAAIQLVEFYLQNQREDRLRDLVASLAAKRTRWEMAAAGAEAALVADHRGDLALPLLERLAQRFPQKATYSLEWMRALWRAGRAESAFSIADQLCSAAPVRPDICSLAARVFVDEVAPQNAIAAYRRDSEPSAQTHLALAALELGNEARADLKAAYRQSDTADLGPLMRWLEKNGSLAQEGHAVGADFALSPLRRAKLAVMIFDRLREKGQTAEANHFAMAHLELALFAPELVSRLCEAAGPADRSALAAALETMLAQSAGDAPERLKHELAGVYAQLAKDDPAHAQDRLERANQLLPP